MGSKKGRSGYDLSSPSGRSLKLGQDSSSKSGSTAFKFAAKCTRLSVLDSSAKCMNNISDIMEIPDSEDSDDGMEYNPHLEIADSEASDDGPDHDLEPPTLWSCSSGSRPVSSVRTIPCYACTALNPTHR